MALDGGLQKMRDYLEDPDLRFFAAQVVGDSSSGQICGRVFGKSVSNGTGAPARFIVYIDGTAGPWIEDQIGQHKISDDRFEFAWANDCVGEGWRET